MQVREHARCVAKQALDVLVGKDDPSLAERGETLPLDLVHHEVQGAVLLEVVDVAREVGVRQALKDAGLAFGELCLLPGLRRADVEALDGDRATLTPINGVERQPLRAFAEHPEQRVAPVLPRLGHVTDLASSSGSRPTRR